MFLAKVFLRDKERREQREREPLAKMRWRSPVAIWGRGGHSSVPWELVADELLSCPQGGLYFAKTDSAKSENLYRNVVNRTLPNQETDKPYSAKSYSGIC